MAAVAESFEMGEADPTSQPAPDPALDRYASRRPAVQLIPGLTLSPLVSTAQLPSDAKAMLAETWMTTPEEADATAEDGEPAPTPSSFDPSAVEFKGMMKRMSKSAPMIKWNAATCTIKETEAKLCLLAGAKDEGEEKEALAAALEAAKASLADADAAIGELKASFSEDPLSLTPWMCTLFDLVDAGLTTFEVGGPFFPHTNLTALFGSDNSASMYEGAEQVLGMFKRRCDRERGEGSVQLLARIVPNIFQDAYKPELLEPLVDKIRANLYGDDAATALDFVQLYWWDSKDHDVMPTLKVLQKLATDKIEVNEESGEATVAEPKKVGGVGLVDFPARSVIQAIQAGVPVSAVQIPFSIADRSFAESLAVARTYNLKVIARGGLMGGVISEKYIGAACPDTTKGDPDLDDVAAALDQINDYGGWDKVQALLRVVKGIAGKHGVKMQSVALRWQIDQGTFPTVSVRWGAASWRQFGTFYTGNAALGQSVQPLEGGAIDAQPIDWQLFQVDSFLDVEDMAALNALAR
ncbi:hypothetical protein FOA52_003531 [Chlamydomonas sp. UWO 241]|nr:hypothetical protein FOA52_003531 [Chlamydomonas sp. UWO 241]